MEKNLVPQKTDTLFVLFGMCFVVFGWFSLALTASNYFYRPIIISGALALTLLSAYILYRILLRATPVFMFIIFAVSAYAAAIGYLSEPTVFSGRDQGSIAEAAYRLAENEKLAFSTPTSDAFFDIYGPGLALNFPGFAYTESGALITQFPLGYISWLGSFIALSGLPGLAISNSLLFALFLITSYRLIHLFTHRIYALAGLALAAFSFLPSWFAKMTLTENLSAFLFVFLSYTLILFLREGKFIHYAGIILTSTLFAFTRLEGFAFLAITLAIITISPYARDIWKRYFWKSVVLPAIAFTFFFLRDFFINLPYYKAAAKGLLGFTSSLGDEGVALASSFPLGSVFFLYGILGIFIFGCLGILILLKNRSFLALIPAILASPTLIYLFSPNVTPDHPWMLRRYLFSVFPALLFSAILGLAALYEKKRHATPKEQKRFIVAIASIIIGLLLLELPAWTATIGFAEHRTLLSQIETFSDRFSNRDLILIDRFATGNNFAMLSGPGQFLYGKSTVYFFNPEDFDKLDLSKFDRVYLLVPTDGFDRYAATFGNRLTLIDHVSFSSEQLESLSIRNKHLDFRLPEKTTVTSEDLLFQIF